MYYYLNNDIIIENYSGVKFSSDNEPAIEEEENEQTYKIVNSIESKLDSSSSTTTGTLATTTGTLATTNTPAISTPATATPATTTPATTTPTTTTPATTTPATTTSTTTTPTTTTPTTTTTSATSTSATTTPATPATTTSDDQIKLNLVNCGTEYKAASGDLIDEVHKQKSDVSSCFCKIACDQNSECNSWEWYQIQNNQNIENRCNLKNGKELLNNSQNYYAGLKNVIVEEEEEEGEASGISIMYLFVILLLILFII